MKALLLAAGLGTRLKPITNYTQKCLVPINGKPLIEYWLENLSNVGVQHFLINTHYFKEQMEQFVLKSKFKAAVPSALIPIPLFPSASSCANTLLPLVKVKLNTAFVPPNALELCHPFGEANGFPWVVIN